MKRSGSVAGLLVCLLCVPLCQAEIVIKYKVGSPRLEFGVGRLEAALKATGTPIRRVGLDQVSERTDVLVKLQAAPRAPAEGYEIRAGTPVVVEAADETGVMYGVLDLSEQVRMRGSLAGVAAKSCQPRFPFRAIKFNLPWMSYRKHESLQLHMDTCRDLRFWAQFLDMMAENRFNALTLWNLHPFTFMIRPKSFPEACPFSDKELAEWQQFWRTLFRMAQDRGIETYLVNWNTFVSPEFARAHNVATYSSDWSVSGRGDTSDLVKRYTRECVTQTIDEYPELTGLGVTLGERMGGMTPQAREDWLVDTFGAGMKAAQRPVKFIHRAPLSANTGSGGSTDATTPLITRAGIDRLGLATPAWVEMKFNWSHGHSSPRLCLIHGGKANAAYWEPPPTNYKIIWTIRNEDFFILRWGEPGFIRQHIEWNGPDYVGGYVVGSECYIPAKNYIDQPAAQALWPYAFERQWLFYLLWGRLLYDPATPDAVFANAFDVRYGRGVGSGLLAAYAAVSRMPLRLGAFHKSTWDFTLYAEGFLAPKKSTTGFISIHDLIETPPLDPDYVSIPDYVTAVVAKRTFSAAQITPVALATALETDSATALKQIAALPAQPPALAYEIADVKAWTHLSLYFADKLRAGVALEMYRHPQEATDRVQAVAWLERAARHWDDLIAVTRPIYPAAPAIHLGNRNFSWENFRDEVQHDIVIARDWKPSAENTPAESKRNRDVSEE